MRSGTALLLASALAACSRGGGREARARLDARDQAARPAPFDWSQPAAALDMGADEAAQRLGSLDFAAAVTWNVSRSATAAGESPLRTHAAERHQVRQLQSGDFQVLAEIDPGTWPGAETGRDVVFAGGTTYARARYAPYRERPTDRGHDARRFRDESFRVAAGVAALCGPMLSVAPRGEGAVLGRQVRRFALSLKKDAGPGEPPAPPQLPQGGYDEDTKRRLELLEGRVPLALDGELALDAETGVPLAVRIKAAFGAKADPRLRAEVDLDARVTGWGSMVGPVTAPRALPDERKPRGVARALEQAGLRKRGEAGAEEPGDEAEGEGD